MSTRDTDPAPAPDSEEITKPDHGIPPMSDPEVFATIVGNLLASHLDPIRRTVNTVADRALVTDEDIRALRNQIRAVEKVVAGVGADVTRLLSNQEEVLGKIRPLIDSYATIRDRVEDLERATNRDMKQ